MFMRVNSKCAHQVRLPLEPGVSGRAEEVEWPASVWTCRP
jgi:hypothetical protein